MKNILTSMEIPRFNNNSDILTLQFDKGIKYLFDSLHNSYTKLDCLLINDIHRNTFDFYKYKNTIVSFYNDIKSYRLVAIKVSYDSKIYINIFNSYNNAFEKINIVDFYLLNELNGTLEQTQTDLFDNLMNIIVSSYINENNHSKSITLTMRFKEYDNGRYI